MSLPEERVPEAETESTVHGPTATEDDRRASAEPGSPGNPGSGDAEEPAATVSPPPAASPRPTAVPAPSPKPVESNASDGGALPIEEPAQPVDPAEPAQRAPIAPRRGGIGRRLLRSLLWLVAVLALVLFGAALALRSERVLEVLREALEERGTAATGRAVTLAAVEVEVLPPLLDLSGLRVAGEAPGDEPFFEADGLRLEPTLLGLWRKILTGRGLHLRQVELRRPRLRLVVREDGEFSLPRLPPGSGDPLRIDALVVESGDLVLDDLQIELSFTAQELRSRLVGEGPGELQGQLAAEAVMLQLPGAEPYPVDLTVNGWVSPGRMDILEGRLQGQDMDTRFKGRWVWAADTIAAELEETAASASVSAPAPREGVQRPLEPIAEAGTRGDAATPSMVPPPASSGPGSGAAPSRRAPRSLVYLEVSSVGEGRFFDHLGYGQGLVDGPLSTDGVVTWRAGEPVVFRGEVASPQLRFLDRTWSAIGGRLEARGDAVLLDLETATYAGGTVAGTVRVDPRGEGVPLEADLRFTDLEADRLLATEGLPLKGLAATIEGSLLYRSTAPRRERGDGWGTFTLIPREQSPGLVVAGDVPFLIDGGELTSSAVFVAAEGQRLDGSLRFDLTAGAGLLAVDLSSDDLAPVADLLLPYLGGDADAAWMPRQGEGDLQVQLRWPGAEASPQVEARLDLEGVETSELRADRVRGVLSTRPGWLDLSSIELSRGDGALLISGAVPISRQATTTSQAAGSSGTANPDGAPDQGSASGPNALDLNFEALGWPLEELASFRELGLPGEGPISGRLTLRGPAGDVRGTMNGSLEPALLAGLAWRRAEVSLGWNDEFLTVEQLRAESAAGTLEVEGSLGLATESLDLALSAPGLDLAEPPFSDLFGERGDRLEGQVALTAQVEGTRSEPRITATARSQRLRVGGDPAPRAASGEPLEGLLEATWDGRQLLLQGTVPGLLEMEGEGRLDLELATPSPLAAPASVDAPSAPGDGNAADTLDLELQVVSEDLRAWAQLAVDRPLEALSGSFEGRVRVAGRALDPSTWRLEAQLPKVRGQLDLPLSAAATGGGSADGEPLFSEPLVFEAFEPVRGRLDADGLRIDSLHLTEFTSASRAELTGRVAETLDLRFTTEADSRWLLPLLQGQGAELPVLADLHGRVEARGEVTGDLAAPEINGTGALRLDAFVAPYLSQEVTDAQARFSLAPGRLELDSLSARIGDGTLAAQGRVDWLHPARPEREPGYRFTGEVDTLRLMYPDGWLQEGSANLVLVADPVRGGRELQGTLNLSQLRYLDTVETGLVGVLQSLLAPERVLLGPAEEWLSSTHLDLEVQAPGTLRVRNPLANLRGDLELEVRGNLARPVLLGNVGLLPGGTLSYAGNEYRLRRGLLTFTNPYTTEPVLDLEATARVRSYEVLLQLAGTLDRLQVEVSSDPPLPELDVMALVAGGRPLAREARPARPGSSDEGQLDAQAFLYGQAATALTDRVNNLFGFDKFRVDPLSEGGDSVSSVRVTVGKRLSKDLFVTYSRDPSTTEEDILEAEWQVSPLLQLIFTQNGDGSFSVDALWDRQF